MGSPFALWVYLSTTPLLWLTATVLFWVAADFLAQWSGRHPLVNPVLLCIVAMALVLAATGTPYRTYFDGAQFVHFLLGPATVAIGVPLFRHWPTVRRNILPMAAALLAGSLTAIVSVLAVAMAFGVPHGVLVALAPKSVTAGIAMAVSEGLGGEPALTAVLVITTGILGAVIVTPLMNAMGVRDYAARGFAVGLASHGIGTARAFVVDPVAGTFAGIAMGLNAVVSSILVPVVLRLIPCGGRLEGADGHLECWGLDCREELDKAPALRH
jgi:predicted murein hydrolase (TIGR00659 family)